MLETYDGNGNQRERTENDNGIRSKAVAYDESGRIEDYVLYDEEENVEYRKQLRSELYSDREYYVEAVYAAGMIQTETHIETDGEVTYKIEYRYSGNEKEILYYSYENGETDTIGYSKYVNGTLRMETSYVCDINDVFLYYRLTKYDENGNEISEKAYDKNWNPMN